MNVVRDEMSRIYGGAFATYGDDPRSFLHNDRASQYERFAMLAPLFARETSSFTVHEIGCSIGHFGDFLRDHAPLAVYSGSDIHAPFVERCRERFGDGRFFVRDVSEALPDERYDYVVTFGTFNIPGTAPRDAWQEAIYAMASAMYALCRRGMGMTFLSTFHDAERTRPDLHYQSERELMAYAFRHLSRHFELDVRGPLFEYGMRIYRPEHVHASYPQPSFARYFKHQEGR